MFAFRSLSSLLLLYLFLIVRFFFLFSSYSTFFQSALLILLFSPPSPPQNLSTSLPRIPPLSSSVSASSLSSFLSLGDSEEGRAVY